MVRHRHSRILPSFVIATVGSALLLTACSSQSTAPSEGVTSTSNASSSSYPVTVKTQFGDITLTEQPKRIIALNGPAIDWLTSVGVQPIALTMEGEKEEEALESGPWMKGLYSGKYDPNLITSEYTAAAEAIASYEPDLIVFSPNVADQDQIDQLSKIAPAYAPIASVDRDWHAHLEDIGALTGKTQEAARVTKTLDDKFKEARDRLPGLQGKTINNGYYLGKDGFKLVPGDWWSGLGLKAASNQPVPGGTPPSLLISSENIGQIGGDVLALALFTGEDPKQSQAKLDADPRFKNLPASKNGAVIFMDAAMSNASTRIGPAGLTWLLSKVVPQLEATALNSK